MARFRAELEKRFAGMTDDELVRLREGESLDEFAVGILAAEIARRGLDWQVAESARRPGEPDGVVEDLVLLTRAFDPTEAHLLRGLLESAGVPTFVADGNLVQANPFLAIAVGFVRVLVPESRLAAGRELLARYEAGEFALSDDDFVEGGDSGGG